MLLFTWINPITKAYWYAVDIWVFNFLNGSLDQSASLYNAFWAFLNVRFADFIPLVFIAGFFIFFPKDKRLKALIGFVSLLVLMLIARELLDFYVEYSNLDRKSPSLIFDNVVRLSQIYPSFNLKDSSATSFPGDHGAVLITWLGYFLFFKLKRVTFWAFVIVIFFSLPRLIAGAHWFSDILVGSFFISFITLAFGLYTPLLNRLNKFLIKITPGFVKNLINMI